MSAAPAPWLRCCCRESAMLFLAALLPQCAPGWGLPPCTASCRCRAASVDVELAALLRTRMISF